MGGRKLLVYVRIVVAAIFDSMTLSLAPIFSSLLSFLALSQAKTFARSKKTPALRATLRVSFFFLFLVFWSNSLIRAFIRQGAFISEGCRIQL